MLQLQNHTEFAGTMFLLPDVQGIDTVLALVKGTFNIDGALSVAEEQSPIVLSDEFYGDQCTYSAIKVNEVKPEKSGDRIFELHFYHANYPVGVKDKVYRLQTIERGQHYLLAKSLDHTPVRFLQIYEITAEWYSRHCLGGKRTARHANTCF